MTHSYFGDSIGMRYFEHGKFVIYFGGKLIFVFLAWLKEVKNYWETF